MEWRNKLAWLRLKYIHVPPMIDWDWIREVRLEEGVTIYLTKMFNYRGVRLTCIDWRRLFHLQEPIFMEICVKIFATAQFRKRNNDDDKGNFTFCLGEEARM